MTFKPIGLGVAGYGHYVRVNFLRPLKDCEAIKIAGIYNRGEERRNQAKEDGYWVTGDFDELLKRDDVEAVFIGTSNYSHKELVLKAAKAKKHIICEKPLALDVKDIDEMVKAVKESGVITHVNHTSIYSPVFIKIRELIKEYIGDIYHLWIRASRSFGLWNQGARHVAVENPDQSGGWTIHHLCHSLNEACILLDSNKAEKVFNIVHKSCPQSPSEEIINTLIYFDNGKTATISDTTSIGPYKDFGIQGTKGDLRYLNDKIYITKPGPTDPMGRPGNLSSEQEIIDMANFHKEGNKNLVTIGNKFAQAVRGGKNELLSFDFVSKQYKIINAMQKSAQIKEAVKPKD